MEKSAIEGFEIHEIKTDDEIEKCIDLQGEIWGLDERGCMSPITLKAMVAEEHKTGIVIGGFLNNEMIAIQIVMPTMEHQTAYGHMIGILEKYRNLHIGQLLQEHLFPILRKWNYKKYLWTYEPLEGRNANNYIDKSGARVTQYLPDYYKVKDKMSGGMSIDRFLAEVHLDDAFHLSNLHKKIAPMSLEEALVNIPVVTSQNFPDADLVLVEIPDDLQHLKKTDMEMAKKFRLDTRKIFTEYINKRGFVSEYLYSGTIDDRRHNYYLLEKPKNLK